MPEYSIQKAAANLIAELNNIDGPPTAGKPKPGWVGWHSVYIQTRVNKDTGDTHAVLMVHILPGHEHKWRPRDKHFDYPVEVHPWTSEA